MAWERVVKMVELKVKYPQTLADVVSVFNTRYTMAVESVQVHPASYREAREE